MFVKCGKLNMYWQKSQAESCSRDGCVKRVKRVGTVCTRWFNSYVIARRTSTVESKQHNNNAQRNSLSANKPKRRQLQRAQPSKSTKQVDDVYKKYNRTLGLTGTKFCGETGTYFVVDHVRTHTCQVLPLAYTGHRVQEPSTEYRHQQLISTFFAKLVNPDHTDWESGGFAWQETRHANGDSGSKTATCRYRQSEKSTLQ